MLTEDYYRVYKSLYYSKFDWRTKKGISTELDISIIRVDRCLKTMLRRGILFGGKKKPVVNAIGYIIQEEIYSLICNYEKRTSFKVKLLDAIRGEIIR